MYTFVMSTCQLHQKNHIPSSELFAQFGMDDMVGC